MATVSQTSPYQYYNQILNEWPTAIAPESQWFVSIDFTNVGVIQDKFSNINNYDNRSGGNGSSSTYWNIPNSTVANLISYTNQDASDNLIGCVFVRDVTVPSEGVDVDNRGLEYGGYQAPATASIRNKYKKFSITFNETNSSFIDFLIRPWIVNVGYFGLIARDEGKRKVKASTVDFIYLARTGPTSPSIIRKIFRFFNVVPTNVTGLKNQYQTEGLQYSTVEFAYDSYSVIDKTAGSQETSTNPSSQDSANPSPQNSSSNPLQYNLSVPITDPLKYNQTPTINPPQLGTGAQISNPNPFSTINLPSSL